MCVYIYIYIYIYIIYSSLSIYTCVYVYIYIYTYQQRCCDFVAVCFFIGCTCLLFKHGFVCYSSDAVMLRDTSNT